MKKTFWEKVGDVLDTGWSYLIFFCLFAGGWFIGFSLPILPIALFFVSLGSVAFTCLLSLRQEKFLFMGGGSVKLSSGEEYNYCLVKVQGYMHFPMIPFMSPFFFFPYKTNYYVLYNLAHNPLSVPNSQVREDLFDGVCFEYERIIKAEYEQFLKDPQYFQEKFDNYVKKQKVIFDSFMGKFEEVKHLKKLYGTDVYSVYANEQGEEILFLHSGNDQYQKGLKIHNKSDSEKITADDVKFEVFSNNSGDVIAKNTFTFTNNLYRRLWYQFDSSTSGGDNGNESEKVQYKDIEQIEELKGLDTRKPLTNEMISFHLSGNGKGLYTFAWIVLYYFGIIFLIIAIGCIFTGVLPGLLVGSVGAPLMIFLAEKFRRKNKALKRRLTPDEFYVVKAICTDIQENGDGEDSYTYTFSDGSQSKGVFSSVEKGFPCFLLFRNNTNQVGFVYSAMTTKLADDVKFTDKINYIGDNN